MEELALRVRKLIIKMLKSSKSGHPGGSLSCVEILVYLYTKKMMLTKDNLSSNERNRFVLSKGHACPALYALFHELGFVDDEEVLTLRKLGSRLQGHPNKNDLPGIDMSTGSLGQGISVAVGMALANKIKGNDSWVYALCGDGEFEEGQVYEALMAAGHYHLNHFIVFIDNNGLQIDGKVEDVMSPLPFKDKLEAFHFHVCEINGHDFNEIDKAVKECEQQDGPCAIIAHTIKGKGVSFMENNVGWHGKPLTDELADQALLELEGAR